MKASGVARYAVIGHPVGHSLSPLIHAQFARQTRQAVSYDALEAATDGFAACVRGFIEAGGRGLNVTLPFKQEAFDFATRHSPRATRAGAVNTLGFDEEGIWGDNTDGIGLVRDLARLERDGGPALPGARVLIVGAGGAVRGILGPLLELEVGEVTIANRSPGRAEQLRSDFSGGATSLTGLSLAELGTARASVYDLVIHATSLSLAGQAPEVPAELLTHARLIYDLSYAPGPAEASTAFLRYARSAGATRTVDGLGMLVEQAAESFFVWRGILPDTAPVLARLRARLTAS